MDEFEPPPKPQKRLQAIALQYLEGDRAPRVIASGAGELAKRILQLADEHQIPVKRDDTLVDLLAKLDIGFEIPAEAYQAVAEILVFLYRTDEQWRKRKAQTNPTMARAAIETGTEPEALPGDLDGRPKNPAKVQS